MFLLLLNEYVLGTLEFCNYGLFARGFLKIIHFFYCMCCIQCFIVRDLTLSLLAQVLVFGYCNFVCGLMNCNLHVCLNGYCLTLVLSSVLLW